MEEVPFEDRTVPKVEIDWGRSFWWWIPVSRAIHPAVRLTSLLFGLAALWLLQLGWQLGRWLFDVEVELGSLVQLSLDIGLPTDQYGQALINSSPMVAQVQWPDLTVANIAFTTFIIVWVSLIAGVFGGIIVRFAAMSLGLRTVAPLFSSIRLVLSRLPSYLWASGMHIVAVSVFLIPVIVLGWFARLGYWPATIAGVILLMLSLPLTIGIGRMVISAIFSYPLSVCAISIEKRADAFEGFSRSNAYLFQRPVVAALTVLLLALLGEVGAFLVSRTFGYGWGLISQTYATASGEANQQVSTAVQTYLSAGNWLTTHLVLAFRFTYFWSAIAALYLILRRLVDGTDLDEMDVMESELEQNPPRIPTTPEPKSTEPAGEATGSSDSKSSDV